MGLAPDFLEWFSCLKRARCRFLVVGGYAVAAAGKPRYTEDLDVLVEPTVANAKRVAAALSAFGFPQHAAEVARQFSAPKKLATLGLPPFQIDVMTSISGVDFATAWAGRREVVVRRLRIPFLGLAELLVNKRASGRDKDLIDVANLRELHRSTRGRRK